MLSSITGQADIIKRLKKAVESPGHAYIFSGEKGMGKFEIARAFAKSLQCESSIGDACGACLSCRVFESGNHPDIMYVKAAKTKAIGVGDVREQMVLPMSEKPFRYKYKIFIVSDPLTPQAQNALLKTIEEPASFGIFIFLTESIRLYLPTVLSRCITLKLRPLSDEEVAAKIGGMSPAVVFAGGNPGRAKELLESDDFEQMRAFAEYVAKNIQGMDITAAMALYSRFDKYREQIQILLDMLYLYYRDMLIESFRASDFDIINETKKSLTRNGNFQMTIELMLLKLAGFAEVLN